MFSRKKAQKAQKGLRAVLRRFVGLNGSTPECGGSRQSASGFRLFANGVRFADGARLLFYTVALKLKALKPMKMRSNFIPTNPTVTGSKTSNLKECSA